MHSYRGTQYSYATLPITTHHTQTPTLNLAKFSNILKFNFVYNYCQNNDQKVSTTKVTGTLTLRREIRYIAEGFGGRIRYVAGGDVSARYVYDICVRILYHYFHCHQQLDYVGDDIYGDILLG